MLLKLIKELLVSFDKFKVGNNYEVIPFLTDNGWKEDVITSLDSEMGMLLHNLAAVCQQKFRTLLLSSGSKCTE